MIHTFVEYVNFKLCNSSRLLAAHTDKGYGLL